MSWPLAQSDAPGLRVKQRSRATPPLLRRSLTVACARLRVL
jgi:hypothetical protein